MILHLWHLAILAYQKLDMGPPIFFINFHIKANLRLSRSSILLKMRILKSKQIFHLDITFFLCHGLLIMITKRSLDWRKRNILWIRWLTFYLNNLLKNKKNFIWKDFICEKSRSFLIFISVIYIPFYLGEHTHNCYMNHESATIGNRS